MFLIGACFRRKKDVIHEEKAGVGTGLLDGLCSVCISLQPNPVTIPDHGPLSRQVVLNSVPGCQLCQRLLGSPGHGPVHATVEQGMRLEVPKCSVKFLQQGELQCEELYFIGIPAVSNWLSPDFNIVGDVPIKNSRQKTESKILQWLRNCDEDHRLCCQLHRGPNANTSAPTRLIDVGSQDNPQVRLLDTERSVISRYLALSHCWGEQAILKTVQATKSAHNLSIPWAQLSKTFQQSVELTRFLSIRHTWIDSLCIVQDQATDWKQESARMGEYYSNAYCTISATGAEDGSAGLWLPDLGLYPDSVGRPLEFWILELPSPNSNIVVSSNRATSSSYQQHVEIGRRVYCTNSAMPFDSPPELIASERLSDRAWAVQERLLSPRVIYFTSGQVCFECLTGIEREDGACCPVDSRIGEDPDELFGAYNMYNTVIVKRRIYEEAWTMVNDDATKFKWLLQQWNCFLNLYVECDLTYETDRVPGLTGLANLLSERCDWTPACGLFFKEDSPFSLAFLCWSTLATGMHQYTPLSARNGPSWSWVTLESTEFIRINPHLDEIAIPGKDIHMQPQFVQISDQYTRYHCHSLKVMSQINTPLHALGQSSIRIGRDYLEHGTILKAILDHFGVSGGRAALVYADFQGEIQLNQLSYLHISSLRSKKSQNGLADAPSDDRYCGNTLFGYRYEAEDGAVLFERLGYIDGWQSSQDPFWNCEWQVIHII